MSKKGFGLIGPFARVVLTLALVVFSVDLAFATPGTVYMTPGMTTPAGAVVAKGQLWAADSINGLCRIAPNAAGVQLIVSTTCFLNGTSQPAYDPVANIIYVGDLAKKTGLWRLNLDSTGQNIVREVNIVPATSVRNDVPVGVALGPDGAVYMGLRADPTIFRVTNPTNDTPGAMQVQAVGILQAGRGVNAMAFRGNDLWIADRNFVDHMDNATLCNGGCIAQVIGGTATIPQAIASDGVQFVYISLGGEVVRYDNVTGAFDVLTSNAVDAAGLSRSYGYIWGLGVRASDGAVFVTADIFGPAAAARRARGGAGGPPPGTGSIFLVKPPFTSEGVVVDPLTHFAMSFVAPATPPIVPLTAPAPLYVYGVTEPRGMTQFDGHLWVSDRLVGLCRVDPQGGGGTAAPAFLTNICAPGTTGLFIPGQPVVTFHTDPITQVTTPWHVFVPDLSAGSQGVWRFDYDIVNQALINPITAVSGLGNPSAITMGPDGNIYLAFSGNNTITRILTPDTNPTVDAPFGTTLDGGGVRSLAFVNSDLYIAEATDTTVITFAPNRTKGTLQATLFGAPKKGALSRLNQAGVLALASDSTDKLYMGVPVDVQAFSVSTTQQYNLADRGFDGLNEDPFVSPTALLFDGTTTLYVADDPFGMTSPQSGRIWAVPLPWKGPLVPAYVMANLVTDASVQLKWHDWATNETGFKIQRQDVPADPTLPFGAWVDVATVGTLNPGGPADNFWTDTNVTPGSTYNYQVASFNATDQSPWTVPPATATVMNLPPAASGLAGTAISDAEVDLTWNDNSASETGFRVERALDAAFTTGKVTFTTPANTTSMADTTTAGNTTYYYRVIAFNANGDGQASNLISVATPFATLPPTITNPGNQTGKVPLTASLQIVAADHVGGNNLLSYSATGLPTGLAIDPNTGLISGTYTAGGTFNTTVFVSNGNQVASAAFTWTVTAPPQAVSVTPNAGVGASQTFKFLYFDPASFSSLTVMQFMINSTFTPVAGCNVQYTQATNSLALMNDAGTGFGPAQTLGTPGTLQNSQCTVNVGTASAAGVGQNLTLTATISFPPTFGGTKNVWMYAESNLALNSGWQLNGSWLVPGAVTVTSPNGGESWSAGSTQAITWNAVGMTENVNIALLKAGAGVLAIGSAPATAGTFNWTLPGALAAGTDYTVRVTSAINNAVSDVSNAPFTVTAGLTVLSPNGGEVWPAGTTHNITWNASTSVTGNVNIALMKAGSGILSIGGAAASAGSFSWTVPANLAFASDYTIRITSASNPSVSDVSNAPFSIAQPITVTAPNGGEVWAAGSTQTITWNSLGLGGSVKIDLLKGGAGFQTITQVPISPGSFTWTLPGTLPIASDYTIRITSTLNGALLDVSNAPFSVVAPLTVIAPNGGEVWPVGTTQNITWTSTGITGNVNVALLKAGVGFISIATNVPVANGTFAWTIPATATPGSTYTIRITSASNGTVVDTSNAPFTIAAPITVLTPNGGEAWAQGTTQNITWNSAGITGNVSIALLKAGVGFQAIAASVPVTNGSFAWTIPANVPIAADYTIRVMSVTNGTLLDVSNGPFSVVAPITVVAPNGGEIWAAGTTQTITWTAAAGLTGNVSITLMKAGVGFQLISAGVPITNGSFAWALPATLPFASDYTVRVMSVTNGALLDVSNAVFSIAPALTVVTPNGGETLPAGTTQTIGWNAAAGLTGTVDIALLKAGAGFQSIATAVPVANGSFAWAIPGNLPLASDYTVRITSSANPAIVDVSNAPFSVVAPITVVTPNGGEIWARGSAQTITWSSLGLTGNVNIALLKAGAGILSIGGASVTAGSFNWTVPNNLTPASDYTIRITSATNGAVVDVSNAPFTIN